MAGCGDKKKMDRLGILKGNYLKNILSTESFLSNMVIGYKIDFSRNVKISNFIQADSFCKNNLVQYENDLIGNVTRAPLTIIP